MTTETQDHWTYNPPEQEIRSEADGSILFDVDNATVAQATIAAAAPSMLLALQAIAGMVVDENTDHAQLSALCIATARAALDPFEAFNTVEATDA